MTVFDAESTAPCLKVTIPDRTVDEDLLENTAQPKLDEASDDINNTEGSADGEMTEEAHEAMVRTRKLERLRQFREYRANLTDSGRLYCHQLKDIQETLQGRELVDACRKFGSVSSVRASPRSEDPVVSRFDSEAPVTAVQDPLKGHNITQEFRTKMTDWMVEVTTSFKCQPRTYFLAVTLLDKYLIAAHNNGRVLENKDIHMLGVTAMYLASKYEDVFPLHSKVVSEKIAHGAISPKQIIEKEIEFLQLFEFQIDFVTHYDFWQTYTDKLEKQLLHNLQLMATPYVSIEQAKELLSKLNQMTMLLIKMSIQCRDFLQYSPSTIVASALYSSTAFLKHSRQFKSECTDKLINEVRKIIFQIIGDELRQHANFMPTVHYEPASVEWLEERQDLYQRQYCQRFIEQIAMDLVDYYKAFDDWHCGLNQLKKFNRVPFN